MMWRLAIVFVLATARALAATNEVAGPELDAKEIIQRLREARPPGNSTNSGVLKIFRKKSAPVEIPVRFQVITTPQLWRSIYQTSSANGATPAFRLTVTQQAGTNFYELAKLANDDSCCPTNMPLAGSQTMIPFAGSDFWVADLGLEFLRWPAQTLLKKDRRSGRACYVIESTNPSPGANGYTKVVSWLDIESLGESAQPAIIYAEAYDARGKLKAFEPKNLEKVNGQYQLQEMEIKNLQTGSRTRIEFNFEANPP